jgi:hypothetical protein
VGWQFPARRRAAGRERLLATAGAALLAAPDAAAVHRVAAEATAELLGLDAPAELARDLDLVPEESRAAVESLRAQVTLALERADLAAEVARRVSVDPLTGLANRTAFSRRLREALGTLDGPPGPPAGRPRPCSCSTWTTSRRSTTAWATPPGTRSCGWWPSGCGAAWARATWPPASAATSSPCSSPGSPTRARRSPWASGWRPSCAPR